MARIMMIIITMKMVVIMLVELSFDQVFSDV